MSLPASVLFPQKEPAHLRETGFLSSCLPETTHFPGTINEKKVKNVIDCYVHLSETLGILSERDIRHPNHKEGPFLSFSNPELSTAYKTLLNALSENFTREEHGRIVDHRAFQRRSEWVWRRLAKAEAAMEMHDSTLIDPANLRTFYDFEAYNKQNDDELKKIGFPRKLPILKEHESIAFVGAGPLPLSAILIHQKTGLQITCYDCDKSAVERGTRFLAEGCLSSAVSYRHASGENIDYCIHPIVFVANLVIGKFGIVQQVGMSRGANTLAIRTCLGAGTLLYKPLPSLLVNSTTVFFDRHTPVEPPYFNTTLFSTLPAWRFKVDSTFFQLTRPPDMLNGECLTPPKLGRSSLFAHNL